MNSPSNQRLVDCFISTMVRNVGQEASSDAIEVFLDTGASGAKICLYYLVNHRTHRIFWSTGNTLDAITSSPPAMSDLLHDPENEVQYWAHVVLFPSHVVQGFDPMCQRREATPFNPTLGGLHSARYAVNISHVPSGDSASNEFFEAPSNNSTLIFSRDDRLLRPGPARYHLAIIREIIARSQGSPSDSLSDIYDLEKGSEGYTNICHAVRCCISGRPAADPEQPPPPSFVPSARHICISATVKKQWGYTIISAFLILLWCMYELCSDHRWPLVVLAAGSSSLSVVGAVFLLVGHHIGIFRAFQVQGSRYTPESAPMVFSAPHVFMVSSLAMVSMQGVVNLLISERSEYSFTLVPLCLLLSALRFVIVALISNIADGELVGD